MIAVISMAGAGSRFFNSGYTIPKYLINYRGKTLFEHSISSLPYDIFSKIIFMVLEEHLLLYDVKSFIDNFNFNNYEIFTVKHLTRGQAETVYLAKGFFNLNEDLLIYNIDTSFMSPTLRNNLLNKEFKVDGLLGSFVSIDEKYSFAKLDEDGLVVQTAEKNAISDNALTGLYHFSKASDFLQSFHHSLKNNLTTNNEFYIAPMYNYLISKARKFRLDIVSEFIPLGTPEDLV